MQFRDPVFLVLSIDVEEEGLFSGKYACFNLAHANVAHLHRLALFCEIGARPTLFCTYGILTDPAAAKIIDKLRAAHDLEVGAHLHFWNTPPIPSNCPPFLTSVPANRLEPGLMREKLFKLFAAAKDFCGEWPASFRMGRWDIRQSHWQLLAELGIKCDASVRPLHSFRNQDQGPEHFEAPADPFWITTKTGRILEVPLTVTPVIRPLLGLVSQRAGRQLRPGVRHWGALALLPVEHPLWLMKLTTLLHLKRQGRVLSLTWHSSEMMPGGSPRLRTRQAVDRFLKKLTAYIEWLGKICNLQFSTVSGLRSLSGFPAAVYGSSCAADWHPRSEL